MDLLFPSDQRKKKARKKKPQVSFAAVSDNKNAMIETSPMCLWSTRTALILLFTCWGLWVPYAIRQKPMPWILKAVAFAAVACGVFTTLVLMPWHCEGCKLW